MSNSDTPCQATPAKDIRDRLMNPCFSKTEAEHWAVREIERLERELAAEKFETAEQERMRDFYEKLSEELQGKLAASESANREIREALEKVEELTGDGYCIAAFRIASKALATTTKG